MITCTVAPAAGGSVIFSPDGRVLSTVGNSMVLYSITITAAFGVLQTVVGSPGPLQVLLFGVAAALVVGLAILAAYGVGTLIRGVPACPLGAAAATLVYLTETAEILLAEVVQRYRGDRQAEQEQ